VWVAKDIAVIIPALNEEESLPLVLAELPSVVHTVVVDNGSEDRTGDVARGWGASVVFEARRGYGSAVQAGIRALMSAPPQVVVILDADHADRADLMGYLAEPILAGHADIVLSDRTQYAAENALTTPQRFGNRLACHLMHIVTGHRYRDMGPFRAIGWDALMRLGMTDPTWGWNVEMQIKAIRHNLRVREIPMPYRCRAAGVSKISGDLRGAARAGGRILWAVGQYRNG
jgi:glycosyltransferase involved in cell wall biosynthesis